MAKKAPNKKVSKQSFDLNKFKKNKGLDKKVKDKELSWIPLSKGFHDAVGIPGIPRGYVTLFRGYSNTGKSTAIYEAIKSCQKTGDLPVIIDTESNFDWNHAKSIGIEYEEIVDEETGEVLDYDGDFIFVDSDDLLNMYEKFDYGEGKEKSKAQRSEPVIEDVQHFMSDLLDAQENDELPRNLCFLWDSIGSLDCYRSVISKTRNNMWNAGALESSFKSMLNHRIPASRKENKQYTNTIAAVQKVWLDNMNTVIKHKGGEGFFYGARLIIHLGGILSHGTSILKATSNKRTFQFGVETKIKVAKNQVNGVELQGKICSTPHGYINPDEIEDYKRNNKDYILNKMNLESGEIKVEKEESELTNEDLAPQ